MHSPIKLQVIVSIRPFLVTATTEIFITSKPMQTTHVHYEFEITLFIPVIP